LLSTAPCSSPRSKSSKYESRAEKEEDKKLGEGEGDLSEVEYEVARLPDAFNCREGVPITVTLGDGDFNSPGRLL
jgi:hypothetical protein